MSDIVARLRSSYCMSMFANTVDLRAQEFRDRKDAADEIDSLRQQLAAMREQVPVAWMCEGNGRKCASLCDFPVGLGEKKTPLYAAPVPPADAAPRIEVFDRRCNYSAFAGSVCNKCGNVHVSTPYSFPPADAVTKKAPLDGSDYTYNHAVAVLSNLVDGIRKGFPDFPECDSDDAEADVLNGITSYIDNLKAQQADAVRDAVNLPAGWEISRVHRGIKVIMPDGGGCIVSEIETARAIPCEILYLLADAILAAKGDGQ